MTFPCVGIILFNSDKTILVSTHSGNFSFPKGKRNKNETDLDTAKRELLEETGLKINHFQLINHDTLDELSNKGKPSVRYYIGKVTKICNNNDFIFDHNELASVQWYDINECYKLDKLKDSRKEILKKAYALYLLHK